VHLRCCTQIFGGLVYSGVVSPSVFYDQLWLFLALSLWFGVFGALVMYSLGTKPNCVTGDKYRRSR